MEHQSDTATWEGVTSAAYHPRPQSHRPQRSASPDVYKTKLEATGNALGILGGAGTKAAAENSWFHWRRHGCAAFGTGCKDICRCATCARGPAGLVSFSLNVKRHD